jgi:hypothetical protein
MYLAIWLLLSNGNEPRLSKLQVEENVLGYVSRLSKLLFPAVPVFVGPVLELAPRGILNLFNPLPNHVPPFSFSFSFGDWTCGDGWDAWDA